MAKSIILSILLSISVSSVSYRLLLTTSLSTTLLSLIKPAGTVSSLSIST